MNKTYGDIAVDLNDHVATVEIKRPPHNFFDEVLIGDMADAFEALDATDDCRALVLCSEGKNFCAGANFGYAQGETEGSKPNVKPLYAHAARLFSCRKPIVAAVQGSAIGGGLGVALVADFRVVSAETRFAANFVKLGIHPGFGLTHTLPRLIGVQAATLLFLTGRRVGGEEAVALGLADMLTAATNIRARAIGLAAEMAANAPLAVESTRATLRADLLGKADLVAAIRAHSDHEAEVQNRLFQTSDHAEGVKAVSQRRSGIFTRH